MFVKAKEDANADGEVGKLALYRTSNGWMLIRENRISWTKAKCSRCHPNPSPDTLGDECDDGCLKDSVGGLQAGAYAPTADLQFGEWTWMQPLPIPIERSGTDRVEGNNPFSEVQVTIMPPNEECYKHPDGDHLDCIPAQMFNEPEFNMAAYPWASDDRGSPGDFVVTQSYGKVFFTWTDYSLCESAFALTRDEKPFLEDLVSTGVRMCGERYIAPETWFDDLMLPAPGSAQDSMRPIGHEHRYCVRSLSVAGAGFETYESHSNCAVFAVQWEALLVGDVVSEEGRIPIEGVTVEWELQGDGNTLRGSVTTKVDGTFKIHIIDLNQVLGSTPDIVQHVKLSYSHNKTGLPHSFVCPSGLCGGIDRKTGELEKPAIRQVTATHFKLKPDRADRIVILDASSVPFTGKVYFPLAAHNLARGSELPGERFW